MADDISTFPNWVKPSTNKTYGYTFNGNNMNHTSTGGGLSRASLKYYQNAEQYSVTFVVNNGDQMNAFNDWYFNICNQGTDPFYIDLDCGDGLLTHVGIIVPGSYSVTGDMPWVITCTIEVEQPVTAGYDGSLYDLMQGGYTDTEALLSRLETFANSDILTTNDIEGDA